MKYAAQSAVVRRLYLAAILIICLLVAFVSRLASAKTMLETDWVGMLTFGKEDPGVDPGIIGQRTLFVTEYDADIIIGLRDDGVVVWKWAQ